MNTTGRLQGSAAGKAPVPASQQMAGLLINKNPTSIIDDVDMDSYNIKKREDIFRPVQVLRKSKVKVPDKFYGE